MFFNSKNRVVTGAKSTHTSIKVLQNVSKNSLKVVAMFGILSLGMGFLNPVSLFAGCSPEQIAMEKANLETQISTLEMMAIAPSWRENANTKTKDWETKISKKYPILKSYLNKAQDLVKKELAKNYSLDTQFSFDLEKLTLKNSQLTGEIAIFTKAIQGVDSENETHYLYGQDQFIVNFDIKTLKLSVSKKAEPIIADNYASTETFAPETKTLAQALEENKNEPTYSDADRKAQLTQSKKDRKFEYKNELINLKNALKTYVCEIKVSARRNITTDDRWKMRNYARDLAYKIDSDNFWFYHPTQNHENYGYDQWYFDNAKNRGRLLILNGGGNDCTNFISQALKAGGLENMGTGTQNGINTWWYDWNKRSDKERTTSTSFLRADELSRHLIKYRAKSPYWSLNQDIADMNSFVAKLDYGDVLAIDDRNNGNTNHIMMVTGFYEKWVNSKKYWYPLVSGHSVAIQDRKIEELGYWSNSGSKTNKFSFIKTVN